MEKIIISDLKFDYPETKVIHEIFLDEVNNLEVRQYLPLEEKVALVQRVMNMCAGDGTFVNPVQVKVITELEIVISYSNIAFADKLLGDDVYKVYDYLDLSGILSAILAVIDEKEKQFIFSACWETSDKLTQYNNSAAGIIAKITEQASADKLNVDELVEKIKDPAVGEFLNNFSKADLD